MKYLEVIISLIVFCLGAYMYSTSAAGTPPSLSGLGFALVAVALLINNYTHHMK